MSDATLYREFTLRDGGVWSSLVAFVKSNAPAFADKGTPLRVIITEEETDRLDEQIRYYFGVVVKTIAEQAWIEGRQFSKEAWHEELAKMFLPTREITTPSGELVLKRSSIARGQISLKRMTKFTKDVEAYASTDLGVVFER
ncbi:recombinase [Paraburkholderia xenovorans]|uniref:recombinase n=1 Tax=Paraburkholderia xenovorans TaxID=36873 RepID=UPI0038BB73E1